MREFYFECSLPVIKKYRSHSNCWPWLLQYTSYIHSSTDKLSVIFFSNCRTLFFVSQSNNLFCFLFQEFGINFVYDTLIFTIVNLSIYGPFVSNRFTSEEYFLFFPQALKSIIFNKTSSQVKKERKKKA